MSDNRVLDGAFDRVFDRVFDIDELIGDTEHLVSFPRVVMSLLQTLNDDYTDMNDIAALIKQDPALTTELIKLCNSPIYYSANQPVFSVEEAIKMIGTEQVTSLCLALCACGATSGLGNKVIEMKDFWQHCLLTACISSVLAENIPAISGGAAFTGGMLHDIGQLPLFYQYPDESIQVLNSCQLHIDQRIVNAEKQIFGFTHEEVGKRLAEKWNFPPQLGLCLSSHHSGIIKTDADKLAMVVHVANILSECLETQEDPELYLELINPTALSLVITDLDSLPDVFEKASSYFDDVQSSILV